MALNPNYEAIGKAFTTQYYQMFDNPATRPQLQALYNAEQSLLSFEGQQMQGSAKIMEKLGSLTFQKIGHLINVLGQLKTDEDIPQSFMQNFVLKPGNDSFFIQHDVFRLVLHNVAA